MFRQYLIDEIERYQDKESCEAFEQWCEEMEGLKESAFKAGFEAALIRLKNITNIITNNMGEPEAYKALEEGYIRVDGKVYNMEKQPQGWCDGCCFYNMEVCPSIAKKVCCTGGVIFHERK